ncbi:hypothetical protein T06_14883 [Trichinella sp. T6]|nr:hypothetical protein T06_14883 [Trichinella sp. T6]
MVEVREEEEGEGRKIQMQMQMQIEKSITYHQAIEPAGVARQSKSSSDVELELNCIWSSGMVYYHHVMDTVLKREIDTANVSIKCEEEIEEKAQCQCCRSRSFSEARLESLSTGGRRQTIKANRPKSAFCTEKYYSLQEEAHNKAASHTVDLAIIRMIFALCQQSITSCRLVEVRGSIQFLVEKTKKQLCQIKICHFARISEAICTIYHKLTNLIKVDRVLNTMFRVSIIVAVAPMQRQRGTVKG